MDAACRGIEVPPHKEDCLCERLWVLCFKAVGVLRWLGNSC